jgi:hypothetical protein
MISDQHNQRGFRDSGDSPSFVPAGRRAITGANLDLLAICQQNEPVRCRSPLSGLALATADPAGFGDHGDYKIPLVLALESTATVTIAPAALSLFAGSCTR